MRKDKWQNMIPVQCVKNRTTEDGLVIFHKNQFYVYNQKTGEIMSATHGLTVSISILQLLKYFAAPAIGAFSDLAKKKNIRTHRELVEHINTSHAFSLRLDE